LFAYLPLANTIKLGTGINYTGTGAIFDEAVLKHPHFRMFVVMGNGITYTLDRSSVPASISQ